MWKILIVYVLSETNYELCLNCAWVRNSNLEILYQSNNQFLTRSGNIYQLRFVGASGTQYTAAKSTLYPYMPSSLSAVLWTSNGQSRYFATFHVSSGTYTIQVAGTYGGQLTDLENASSHAVYGTIMWIKNVT